MSNEELTQKIHKLQSENEALRNQLQVAIDKEKLFQSTISKIKQIQNDYESSYMESMKDYKLREEDMKKKFEDYQKILEMNSEENEKRLNEEIESLQKQLKEKNAIINNLQNTILSLNEKMTKDEFYYHFKEKEFEDIIISKDRKLNELNDAIKQTTKEATEEIKRLSDQLEEFQMRTRNAALLSMEKSQEITPILSQPGERNENNENININNERIINNNKLNNNIENENEIEVYENMDNDRIRNKEINNNMNVQMINVQGQNGNVNLPDKMNPMSLGLNMEKNYINNTNVINQNEMIDMNNLNINNLIQQIYYLQNENKNLANGLQQKEEEVNFWKNVRTDLSSRNLNNDNKDKDPMSVFNALKVQNLEKKLVNCNSTINALKKQYNDTVKKHENEISVLKNAYETNLNQSMQLNYHNYPPNFIVGNNQNPNQSFNKGDIKGLKYTGQDFVQLNEDNRNKDNNNNSYNEIKNNNILDELNEKPFLNAINTNIPTEEGIRNEYINSEIRKIKISNKNKSAENNEENSS